MVGLDNLNDYYDPALKAARLHILRGEQGLRSNRSISRIARTMERLFAEHRFARVVHLAAQAGVRDSIDHPHAYVDANLEGFVNVLEGAGIMDAATGLCIFVVGLRRRHETAVFGERQSRSSVSLYAATKKADELIAHSYSHLYRLPVTGLRFFTTMGRGDGRIWRFSCLRRRSRRDADPAL